MSQDRIALDVMGGDNAPAATLRGALRAASASGERRVPPERVLLVGPPAVIDAWLAENGGDPGFGRIPASQVVAMGEAPAQALRAKPDNSISRSILAVVEGTAGAALSMGNTGACVGAATLLLGTLEGVRRPGIAVTLGLARKALTLIDMGANIAPRASDLHQYAVMGSVLAERTHGIARPRVALLNVGEEPGKGTDLLKEAYGLLESSGLAFVGNVEGSDLFRDKADVIVTDGFTGNVALKLMEELAGFMLRLVVTELKLHQAAWAGQALDDIREQIDYAQYGGALLLGVRGIVVIGHGRSDDVAVANALWQAARALDTNVNESIVAGLGAVRAG